MELLESGKLKVFGAAAGAGLVTVLGLGMVVNAQESPGTATPETQTTPESTPSTDEGETVPSPNFSGVEEEKTALTEYATEVTDQIAEVQTDRDSITTSGDLTAVDDLISKANDLLTKANASLASNDVDSASNQLVAANMTASAAKALLKASLADFGLPSQQDAASGILANAFNEIDNATGKLSATENADASTYLATAQALYQDAYDLYNAGTYQQAAGTARVAAQVAQIAAVLDGSLDIRFGPMDGGFPNIHGDGGQGGGAEIDLPGGRRSSKDGSGFPGGDEPSTSDNSASTPEEVPSPTFD